MPQSRHEKLTSNQGSPGATDPEQFAARFRDAYPRLHLVAQGIIGDRTHAHDIVQEAAVIALEKADQFQAGASYAAWLAGIVRRCAWNYASKVRGRKTAPTDPDLLARTKEADLRSGMSWPISGQTGQLAEMQQDFDDEVLRALSEIAEDARCCFLLRAVQNLSYAEISDLMQVPQGTAMSHVHRARQKLRRLLEQRAPRSGTTKTHS